MNSKKPEKRFSVRLTDKKLIEFVDKQGNLNNTIIYLIEQEIAKNGIRDLQKIIPAKRTNDYFNKGGSNNEWRTITKRFTWKSR